MGRTERSRELARRRSRRAKITKLKIKYATARTEGEREEIAAKARRLSPFIKLGESA